MMTKLSLQKLVQATRTARDTAEVLDSDKLNDNIFCNLMDIVYEISGGTGEDMDQSLGYRLIQSDMDDGQVADTLLAMAK